MKTFANQVQLDNPYNPELVNWETSSHYRAQIYRQIDDDIKELCRSLWEHGIETRWSCSGKLGHMCSRTIIVIPACICSDKTIKERIEKTMSDEGIIEYWLSRVFSHVPSSSGMQEYWLLELPNPQIDTIAYPIPYRKAG